VSCTFPPEYTGVGQRTQETQWDSSGGFVSFKQSDDQGTLTCDMTGCDVWFPHLQASMSFKPCAFDDKTTYLTCGK